MAIFNSYVSLPEGRGGIPWQSMDKYQFPQHKMLRIFVGIFVARLLFRFLNGESAMHFFDVLVFLRLLERI